MRTRSRSSTEGRGPLLAAAVLAVVVGSAGCSTLPPPPPHYVYETVKQPEPPRNSLWHDSPSLYEDLKARRLNDIVTIRVVESFSGSGKASTASDRTSTLDAGVDDVFGAPLHFGFKNLFGQAKPFSPTVKGNMTDEFEGTGETKRSGRLVGTITAKVVEVQPNGNLVIESRKEVTINREKQILVLRGIIRPDDIDVDNTVSSQRVADAQIYLVGKGVIQDKQSPGWMVRILDNLWPF